MSQSWSARLLSEHLAWEWAVRCGAVRGRSDVNFAIHKGMLNASPESGAYMTLRLLIVCCRLSAGGYHLLATDWELGAVCWKVWSGWNCRAIDKVNRGMVIWHGYWLHAYIHANNWMTSALKWRECENEWAVNYSRLIFVDLRVNDMSSFCPDFLFFRHWMLIGNSACNTASVHEFSGIGNSDGISHSHSQSQSPSLGKS